MDPLEESVRRALHASSHTEHIDADAFLANVHRGARERRTRRAAGSVAATVAVVTAGGYVGMASGIFTESSTPIAGRSTVMSDPGFDITESLPATSEPVDGGRCRPPPYPQAPPCQRPTPLSRRLCRHRRRR